MKKSIILISLFLMLSVLAYSHTLGLGLYVGYDFGPGRVNDTRFNKNDYGAVDIGGQFSFYFVDN